MFNYHLYQVKGKELFGKYNNYLGWLNTDLRAVSGHSCDGVCFYLDKHTWRRKKQWYTEDDFSKSTH